MFSFIFGAVVIGVTCGIALLLGDTPADSPVYGVVCAVGGWFCFAPVRRALFD